MNNLTDRMKTLVGLKTTELKKYKEMEELTGITAASWRSWWNRGGPPSGEMVEAVSAIWPEYAFWLVTGIDDYKHGHHAPTLHESCRHRTAARDLFLAEKAMQLWIRQNSFDWSDWENAQHPDTALSDEARLKLKAFESHRIKIEALDTIRSEQETSLQKFERDEFMKYFLPPSA